MAGAAACGLAVLLLSSLSAHCISCWQLSLNACDIAMSATNIVQTTTLLSDARCSSWAWEQHAWEGFIVEYSKDDLFKKTGEILPYITACWCFYVAGRLCFLLATQC
jgi:hypothetical protein